jgi:hypothetical protein
VDARLVDGEAILDRPAAMWWSSAVFGKVVVVQIVQAKDWFLAVS